MLLGGCITWLPVAAWLPPHDPEAEQELALLLVHESVVVCPCWMLVGLAVKLSDGAGVVGADGASPLTPTRIVRLVPPRGPEHPSV